MIPLFVVVGLVLLALPGWIGARRGRFSVLAWARMCRVLLLCGALSVLAGLGLWAMPALLHTADGLGVPGLCDHAVHHLPLGGLEVALLAGVVAATLMARGAAALIRAEARRRDARIDDTMARVDPRDGFELVVVPSPRLVATTLPGRRSRVLLSDSLVDRLDEREVGAVIRHELAHQQLDHSRDLLLAGAIRHSLGWLPPVRRSLACFRIALEESADRVSADGAVGGKAALRSALVRLATDPASTASREEIAHRIQRIEAPESSGVLARTDVVSRLVVVATVVAVTLGFASQLMVAVTACV